MKTERRKRSRAVRRRIQSAVGLCSDLETREAALSVAIDRTFAPIAEDESPPPDVKPWVRWLLMLIRALIDRLLQAEDEHQEVLPRIDEPRARRNGAVREVRRQLQAFRLLGLWNQGPVVPKGPTPTQPFELLELAATVSDHLASPDLELSPGLKAGIKLYPNMKTEFDAAVTELDKAIYEVHRLEHRISATRAVRNEVLAEFDFYYEVLRCLGRSLCALSIRPRHRREVPVVNGEISDVWVDSVANADPVTNSEQTDR